MWRQPKSVWAVAFACVIAFMGIGLVDPILKSIGDELGASPSQVSLLFTSYMVVMGLAMLVTGAVSSRLGAKKTLLIGLTIIIVGAGLAGTSDTVGGIIGFRAVWGLGNALFIATALATIVSAAKGSVGQAIVLYEAALGIGIAAGPLIGGLPVGDDTGEDLGDRVGESRRFAPGAAHVDVVHERRAAGHVGEVRPRAVRQRADLVGRDGARRVAVRSLERDLRRREVDLVAVIEHAARPSIPARCS